MILLIAGVDCWSRLKNCRRPWQLVGMSHFNYLHGGVWVYCCVIWDWFSLVFVELLWLFVVVCIYCVESLFCCCSLAWYILLFVVVKVWVYCCVFWDWFGWTTLTICGCNHWVDLDCDLCFVVVHLFDTCWIFYVYLCMWGCYIDQGCYARDSSMSNWGP